jgi:hypothetical protein
MEPRIPVINIFLIATNFCGVPVIHMFLLAIFLSLCNEFL